jgi:aminotransferase
MTHKPTNGTAIRYNLMDLAATLPDVISLGRGDPDLATPAHILVAAKDAAHRGEGARLTPPAGLPELRQAIADKLHRDNHLPVEAENILVTTGGQEAMFLLMQALLDPGDEILVPDPRYTSYDQAVAMAGGQLTLIPTAEHSAFDLDADAVARCITSRTKALLLVTPSNPTAGIITEANLRRITDLAHQHNLIIIADEIYEQFVFDGWRHLSIGSLPGMAERTFTLNGFSKTYAMTGWRVGYLAAPVDFIQATTRFKEITNLTAPTISQWAATAALTGPQDCVADMRATYDERRQLAKHALDDMDVSYSDRPPRRVLYLCQRPLVWLLGHRILLSLASRESCHALSRHWLWRGLGRLRSHFTSATEAEIVGSVGAHEKRIGKNVSDPPSPSPTPRFLRRGGGQGGG